MFDFSSISRESTGSFGKVTPHIYSGSTIPSRIADVEREKLG